MIILDNLALIILLPTCLEMVSRSFLKNIFLKAYLFIISIISIFDFKSEFAFKWL